MTIGEVDHPPFSCGWHIYIRVVCRLLFGSSIVALLHICPVILLYVVNVAHNFSPYFTQRRK